MQSPKSDNLKHAPGGNMAASDETGQTPVPGDKPKVSNPQSFKAAPSSRAISLVAVALLIGFLAVLIVSSDNDSKENKADSTRGSETTSTTTVVPDNDGDNATTAPTTTVAPVDGARDPGQITVLVLNGSNIAGVAGKVTTALAEDGYKTVEAANDESKGNGTFVYYKSGYKTDAEQLANNVIPDILDDLQIKQSVRAAELPSSVPTDWEQENIGSANIVIVVGNATS